MDTPKHPVPAVRAPSTLAPSWESSSPSAGPPSAGSIIASLAAMACNTSALLTGHVPADKWYWVVVGNVIAALPVGVVKDLGRRLRLPFLKE